jgi:hypothetical protein
MEGRPTRSPPSPPSPRPQPPAPAGFFDALRGSCRLASPEDAHGSLHPAAAPLVPLPFCGDVLNYPLLQPWSADTDGGAAHLTSVDQVPNTLPPGLTDARHRALGAAQHGILYILSTKDPL